MSISAWLPIIVVTLQINWPRRKMLQYEVSTKTQGNDESPQEEREPTEYAKSELY